MEKELLEDMEPMLRLALKGKVLKDWNDILANNNKFRECHSKRNHKRIERILWKDVKDGFKQIDQKVPVFVELPKYSKETDESYAVEQVDETGKKSKEVVFPEKKTQKKIYQENLEVDVLDFKE